MRNGFARRRRNCRPLPDGLWDVSRSLANTHANFQEANRCFFRQTVLPLGVRIGKSFARRLAQFGDGIRIVIDSDRIDALAADRAALWERVPNPRSSR